MDIMVNGLAARFAKRGIGAKSFGVNEFCPNAKAKQFSII
jgi:hypothetical protein